jgi:hypothetical protein
MLRKLLLATAVAAVPALRLLGRRGVGGQPARSTRPAKPNLPNRQRPTRTRPGREQPRLPVQRSQRHRRQQLLRDLPVRRRLLPGLTAPPVAREATAPQDERRRTASLARPAGGACAPRAQRLKQEALAPAGRTSRGGGVCECGFRWDSDSGGTEKPLLRRYS